MRRRLDLADSEAEAVEAQLQIFPHDALIALEFAAGGASVPAGSPRVRGLPDVSGRLRNARQARFVAAHSAASCGVAPWLQEWADARPPEITRATKCKGPESVVRPSLADIEAVWLEYDLRRCSSPSPVVCLKLPKGDRDLGRWLASLPARSEVPKAQRATLELALEWLPGGARPMYLFDLSARSSGDVRLELLGLGAKESPGYLSRISAPIPAWLLELSECLDAGDRAHLSFDIKTDGSVAERIGFETSYRRQPSREAGWAELFEHLGSRGLVANDPWCWLSPWLGQDRKATAEGLWPNEVESGSLARTLSHVKVAGGSSGLPEVKIYLLFQWLESAIPRSSQTRIS